MSCSLKSRQADRQMIAHLWYILFFFISYKKRSQPFLPFKTYYCTYAMCICGELEIKVEFVME